MKIGVVGLGLIGGSIFKSLLALSYDVVGISKSQQGQRIYSDYKMLKDCNIVFVCSPMNKTLEVLAELESYVDAETIVTDVCSLKEFVSKKKYSYKFVPSHPMAGTEHKGYEHSFAELFNGATWAITPIEDFDYLSLVTLIEKMGAHVVVTSPQKHDEAVAMISHMPMVISQALFSVASENELALKLASSGFRDMTRLALSNEEMAQDMISLNSDNIQNSILKLYSEVGNLMSSDYLANISRIKKQRSVMYKNGKNVYK